MKLQKAMVGTAMALLIAAPQAQAELVTYQFTAVVDFVDDWGGVLVGSVNPGDTITGTYTIETSTPDSSSSEYYKMYYPMEGPGTGFDFQMGPHSIQTAPSGGCQGLQYVNDTSDYFNTWNNCNFTGTLSVNYAAVDMYDSFGTVLNGSEDINTPPPAVNHWEYPHFFVDGDGFIIVSQLTSIELAIPDNGQSGPVQVIPGAGPILAGQKFDLGMIIDEEQGPVGGVQLFVNGMPVNMSQCSTMMPLNTTSTSMICEYFDWNLMPGTNVLDYEVNYLNGQDVQGSVEWQLLLPAL